MNLPHSLAAGARAHRSIKNMGVCYRVVNPDKQEYFDIDAFGDDDRNPAARSIFCPSDYLHALAIAYLVVGESDDSYRARWSRDKIIYINDHDDEAIDNVIRNYKDITTPILDELCDVVYFIDEIISRASKEEIWLPITRRLLDLVDNPEYVYFKRYGEFKFKSDWDGIIQMLRDKVVASEEFCK